MKTEKTRHVTMSKQHHAFDIYDVKGRAIGAFVYLGEADFVEAPDGPLTWYSLAVGQWFTFRAHATRNGRCYGAVQPEQYFASVEERDAAVEKYLAGVRKRAAKLTAK